MKNEKERAKKNHRGLENYFETVSAREEEEKKTRMHFKSFLSIRAKIFSTFATPFFIFFSARSLVTANIFAAQLFDVILKSSHHDCIPCMAVLKHSFRYSYHLKPHR